METQGMRTRENAPLDATGGDPWERERLRNRRVLFFSLVGLTIVVLTVWLGALFVADGLSVVDLSMVALFALTLPWLAIGFWNGLIGFILLRQGPMPSPIVPLKDLDGPPAPVSGRTALVVPIRDEDPAQVFANLDWMLTSLKATGEGHRFTVFILSDTRDDGIAAEEERLFHERAMDDADFTRHRYRRRADNAGFKAGNIRDFLDRSGDGFDFMIVLDADSRMTGEALCRLVRLMVANPRLGILQTLIVGLPAASAFARLFQFGMRHGMRSYTMGSAWWQGPSGPYWGHNAIIRVAPFRRHCALPVLPGDGPLGGSILSHDQVEAVLMRSAGYDVRVLPFEDGSFEANPPSLPAFMKRDLRWCQGNLQYFRLLDLPVRPLGRVQLVLAILMYLGAPCWIAFLVLAALQPVLGHRLLLTSPPAAADAQAWTGWGGPALLATVVLVSLAPKLFGLLDVLLDRDRRLAYGGTVRVVSGGIAELLFSTLLAPVMAVTQTVFMAGLCFGRRIGWSGQMRQERALRLAEAIAALWPPTAAGFLFALLLLATAPHALPWAFPLLAGLLLSIPLAVFTAHPAFGQILARYRVCAIPEEIDATAAAAALDPVAAMRVHR
jgi:membrane glycosyltransferase